MDFFIEQLVKRKRTSRDYVRLAICLIAAVMVVAIMILSIPTVISPVIFLIGIGIILFLNKIKDMINIEYEYCFTNGSLDVDKIIAENRRGRMTEVNAREIEIMATRKNPEYNRYMNDKAVAKVMACSSPEDDDVCFVVYEVEGNKKMLVFNPNERIREGFLRYNPRKVFLKD